MESHNYKKIRKKSNYFCTQYEMNQLRYQLSLYCHNLVEMWLNRLPMTPRFSVSSKDDSNMVGCCASSSEDDCNMVFAWVLDLLP